MLTKETFLKSVANHELDIIRDDGVYRHLRFKKPGDSNRFFELVTWPGYLCYTGDMGCYVFQRLNDMFDFFRCEKEDLGINPNYWSEKLEAKFDEIKELDEKKIISVINDYRKRWIRDFRYKLTKENRRNLWEQVTCLVLKVGDSDDMLRSADNFCGYWQGRRFYFEGLFEHNFDRFKHSYLWCCYAIVWGIRKYDEVKANGD